jgi:hypothetical protein
LFIWKKKWTKERQIVAAKVSPAACSRCGWLHEKCVGGNGGGDEEEEELRTSQQQQQLHILMTSYSGSTVRRTGDHTKYLEKCCVRVTSFHYF